MENGLVGCVGCQPSDNYCMSIGVDNDGHNKVEEWERVITIKMIFIIITSSDDTYGIRVRLGSLYKKK
jgi:hypothetical protein